jgi:eukaryotic-like serine/threonine-protein kinase
MTGENTNNLEINSLFGHYRILKKIGAGGMGEVYLAEDTRLKRKIALKVLPSAVASNEERMRRFTQEAEAAAALNHPSVAHIYEIGETDGTHFIAMEYVDGVTLNEKIYHEKTLLRKLLKYFIQVAEGLAKAHAAGIVHRDLKPDNIMISRDDYAKILDFGLAKLVEPQKTNQSDSSGETATAMMPQHSLPGMIMGTAGYMSPEQAQGRVREIDHRSDIFSFGCIFFEAATGRKAFEGKDQIDSLHKIVHAPTPQIQDFNPDAPQDLQRIVRRCLAKEPDKRYQSIKDVAIELDELRQELKDKAALEYSVQPESTGSVSAISSQQVKTDSTQQSAANATQTASIHPTSSAEYVVSGIRSHKRSAAIILSILILALGGIAFALYRFWGASGKPPQAIKVERLTTNGKSADAAISPDGKYVVYVLDEGGQQSLWTRQVATSSNVQIIPPASVGYWALSFTPDGNYINFVKIEENALASLYQMPVLGGAQKKLLFDMDGAVSYSPDGKQFAFIRGNNPNLGESVLMIANADGTGERILALRKKPETFPWHTKQTPAWSPDGKTIACITGGVYAGSGQMNVIEVNAADGSVKPITTQGWYEIRRVAWLKDKSGLLILAADKASSYYTQQIWHVSYPGGEARRITTDFNNYLGMSLTADSDAIAAVQSNRISSIWVVPNADASRAVQIKSGGNNDEGKDGLSLTPDNRVVYYSRASGADDIWIMNGDGTNPKQLTVDAGANYDFKVTPDNRYIVFTSERTGGANLWRMDLDGGNPKQLTNGNSDFGAAISPDSQSVIYSSDRSGNPAIWKVSINGGDSVRLTEYAAENPEVSPDGKLISCTYREDINSNWRFAIIPIDGGKPLKVFDLPVAPEQEDIRWSPDGRAINYVSLRNGVSNIWSFPLDSGQPKQLTDFKTDRIYNFKWSPDGKQLVLARGTTTSDVVLIRDFR